MDQSLKMENMMLTLTRKLGESVFIGKNITLTVQSSEGSQVKLGIDAPKEITIVRKEIANKYKASKDIATVESV